MLFFTEWCFPPLGIEAFAAFIMQDEPDRFSDGIAYKHRTTCICMLTVFQNRMMNAGIIKSPEGNDPMG